MRENVLSLPTRILVVVFLGLAVIWPAVDNLVALRVKFPIAFLLVVPGFALLAFAKASLYRAGIWISFGDREMSAKMSNLYRVGYYLIFWGVLLTFL
ncbi:MAG: hypothetical protein EHM61_24690 [Acidobacteria bacterium]|nr:MAG: hypothetical protein EHM61_24690 [Acidobacteriota bacterium]